MQKSIPDFIVRALKTFIQAFVPVIITNIALISNHIVAWDFADWEGWLLPILISAVAAGIAAVWNLIIEKVNAKAQAQIFASMSKETIEKLLNSAIEALKEQEEKVEAENKEE